MVHASTSRGVVVGAGLSGLAAAILLQQQGFEQVTVLEKRKEHTRENFILLNHLGASRLRDLGVYGAWKDLTKSSTEYFDQVYIKGNIEKMVQSMQEQGLVPPNAPANALQFSCASDLAGIIKKCRSMLVDVDERGRVINYGSVSHETVVACQDQGVGIEFVQICELEKAMAKVALERGIKIEYEAGDVILHKSADNKRITSISYGLNGSNTISDPALVIDCEGAHRSLATEQLGCKEVDDDERQWFVLFEVDKYYGPDIFLVINEHDEDFPEVPLRHLVCGGIQGKETSFYYIQLPERVALSSDVATRNEFIWRHIDFFVTRQGLGRPNNIVWSSAPFECRETYLKSPCFGENALVIGDAARAGSFQSGAGYNLILVNDLAAVEQVAQKLLKHESISSEFLHDIAAQVEQTSAHFHKLNLERYFSGNC